MDDFDTECQPNEKKMSYFFPLNVMAVGDSTISDRSTKFELTSLRV